MKNQANGKGGILLIIMGLVSACFTVGWIIVAFHILPNNFPIFALIPACFVGLISLAFVGFGIWMLVKGGQSAKIKQDGRKSSCEIYNILRVKNGYQMVVTYKGESGTEYKQALYIGYQTAALFKPGMKIECYILGENCYVDPSHIVEVKDPFDF